MMAGTGLSVLFGGMPWSAAITAAVNSDLGVAVQALSPLLLAFGVLTRLAAAAILLQAVLLATPGMAAVAQGLAALLLLRLIVGGPGPFALDRLLQRGAESLAVPGAAALRATFDGLERSGTGLYQLGLRLWLAATLVLPSSAGPWLPRPSLNAAELAPVLAALLVAGAGIRPVTVLLLLTLRMTGGSQVDWALLLLVLMVGGAGALSVDGALAARLRRMTAAIDRATLPHVVVVGGGFAGIAAVRGLRRAACRVTLIDQHNYHLFQPLLYQVATASLSPGDIATPVREMLREQDNVRVLLARVMGVDPSARSVVLERGAIAYDYLVLATGAQHGYFGRDDWAEFAPGLKTIEDGTAIRRRLLLAFEEAESAASEAERAEWLTFVVVGGGPTGVELAGAIAELARHGMQHEFRRIDPASARVVLVQSGPRLLPAFPESLSLHAERDLRSLGVEVRLGGRVDGVSAAGASIGGILLPARTVLWAAGVMASPAAAWCGAAADRAGRVVVGQDLSVPGAAGVFAIGDTALVNAWKGEPVPGLAPAAKQEGAYAARVIRAALAGRTAPPPFRYRHGGNLATIGRQSAVADFGIVRLRGALAWWLWGAAHITFLVGGRSRASVIVQWLWAYLTYRRAARLITEAR